MCEWEEWEERYWTICWKSIFPYPCRKIRTVRKWCCLFSWVKESRWGIYCFVEGCANGQRYEWSGFCFNVFGTEYFYNKQICFDSEKIPSGPCEPLVIGPVFRRLFQEVSREDSK